MNAFTWPELGTEGAVLDDTRDFLGRCVASPRAEPAAVTPWDAHAEPEPQSEQGRKSKGTTP